jgi:hypothetical protein
LKVVQDIAMTKVARLCVAQFTKTGEIYQMTTKICHNAIKYTAWSENGPNGHKIYQNLPLQVLPKFTQIWIFGLKTNYLATLALDTRKNSSLPDEPGTNLTKAN